ncbi:glycosyltransferase [Kineococcus terrestris]|uniref:glycosyltransferase n=1 Tax=Kineococcus terrestris TaxID=2044856 RepID=UPI0034DB4D77
MAPQEPAASAVVRTFDSAGTVGETIASLRRQDVPVEVVVVDSGSTDGTLDLVRDLADVVVELPPGTFTYGGSLNTGASRASAPVHLALSSHCVLPRPDWVSIAVGHVRAGAAAVVGLPVDGERRPLAGPFTADHRYVLQHQHWGFSNHASAWSAEVWQRHRFDEQLSATEDKEWTWRALADSGPLVVDPRLVVPGDHRRSAGVRAYHRRLVKEITAIQHLRPLPPFGAGRAAREWTRRVPADPFLSQARRFGRTRLVEVHARWLAGRTGGGAR